MTCVIFDGLIANADAVHPDSVDARYWRGRAQDHASDCSICQSQPPTEWEKDQHGDYHLA